jgi:hypothetical protein
MVITKKAIGRRIFSFLLLAIFSLAIIAVPVKADESLINNQIGLQTIGGLAYNSAGEPQDLRITIVKIINIVLTFLGVIFLALIIVAGFQYMTSGGNEEKIKKSVGLLKNAIIGLVIIMAAWAITRYIFWTMTRVINNAVDYRFYSPY